MFRNFLNSKSESSMMRLGFLLGFFLAIVLITNLSTVLMIQAWKEQKIDWLGISGYITSVGLFLTPIIGGKYLQSKEELKTKE